MPCNGVSPPKGVGITVSVGTDACKEKGEGEEPSLVFEYERLRWVLVWLLEVVPLSPPFLSSVMQVVPPRSSIAGLADCVGVSEKGSQLKDSAAARSLAISSSVMLGGGLGSLSMGVISTITAPQETLPS